jgi:hypothetical protein
MVKRVQADSLASPDEALILFMRYPPTGINYFPKVQLPNLITLRVRISTYIFW